MPELLSDEVIEGVVVDELAGTVRLGANGARHALAPSITIRMDDGREVTLVDLDAAVIDPVVTERAPWHELEAAPGARLCATDAPAPDVTCELHSALVRAGERVAVWGRVREFELVDSSGYRAGGRRCPTVLAPTLVFVGDDAMARLERARAKATPTSTRGSSPRWSSRTPRGVVPMIGALAVYAVLFVVEPPIAPVLLVCAGVALALPLAFDAWSIASYRTIPLTGLRRGLAGGVLLLLFGVTILLASFSIRERDHATAELAAPAMLMAILAVIVTTAKRRRLTRLVAHAPPIESTTWGAIDGVATSARAARIADESVLVADGVRIAGRASSFVREASTRITVGDMPVNLDGALWLATTTYAHTEGETRWFVDGIADGSRVRVVGRLVDGVLAKGGADSLLLFGSGDADPSTTALAMAKRDQLAARLAGLGAVATIAAYVLAVF